MTTMTMTMTTTMKMRTSATMTMMMTSEVTFSSFRFAPLDEECYFFDRDKEP